MLQEGGGEVAAAGAGCTEVEGEEEAAFFVVKPSVQQKAKKKEI